MTDKPKKTYRGQDGVRLKMNSIIRTLQRAPPSFVVPGELVPKASEALSAIHSLLNLLDSHRTTPLVFDILSKVRDHWWSIWSWSSVFINSCVYSAEVAVHNNYFSRDLVDVFKVLAHVMSPYTESLFDATIPISPRCFRSLVHSSRDFYSLLLKAITFASLHVDLLEDLYFSTMEVFYALFRYSNSGIDGFLTAVQASPYPRRMPSLLLCPLYAELSWLRLREFRPRKLLLSVFFVHFMCMAYHEFTTAYTSQHNSRLFLNLLRLLFSTESLKRIKQNAFQGDQSLSLKINGPPIEAITFTVAQILEILMVCMEEPNRCIYLVEEGLLPVILRSQFFTYDPELEDFFEPVSRSTLDHLFSKTMQIVQYSMAFRGTSRVIIRKLRKLIKGPLETKIILGGVASLEGQLWPTWVSLKSEVLLPEATARRKAIGTYWKETVRCSNPQCLEHRYPQKVCSRCLFECYCSPSCQRMHWRDHRKNCKRLALDYEEGKPTPLSKLEYAYLEATVKVDALHTFASRIAELKAEFFAMHQFTNVSPIIKIEYRDSPPDVSIEDVTIGCSQSLVQGVFRCDIVPTVELFLDDH
ncbi:hypothetical protein VKT23_020018 [Stygiomarasmius scandens]|uniref:MYND-type domain-containing protein n=1 Tax=Marasmiellus scandens TaxID=2682957 RepID=A0ABR1INW2_9AGAR